MPDQPTPSVPTITVAVPLVPLPSAWEISRGNVGDDHVLWLTFSSPMSAQVVVLDRAAALRLANELREKASGLIVVPGNGDGGMPGLGDLKP